MSPVAVEDADHFCLCYVDKACWLVLCHFGFDLASFQEASSTLLLDWVYQSSKTFPSLANEVEWQSVVQPLIFGSQRTPCFTKVAVTRMVTM